uniref:Endonuclease/exonuclease/phosphatase domain-containing protein n=1 Tax=Timema cristinae TaxID=61476 RepID=A0A7R9H1U0_TIMCR|nr:unnamed protein product [Timema cristinae]
MDKLAELGRAQHKRHQTQDWARNLEDEDINVELSDNETEDSEFTDASILKRKLLFKPKEDKPPKSVKVANQYEILTVREEEPMETIEIPSENARQVTSNTQKSKPKLPPIVVAGTANYSKISKTMKTTMTGTFKIFYIRDGLKIHTSTLDDFKTLQAYLKQTGQEYHTFTLPRDKPLKLVIKGLPPNMPTDDIKEELHTMGYTATDIRQFTSKTQTENAAQDIQLTFTLEPMTYKTQVIEQNQIRILIWNANGILQQTQEFEDLMQTYGIDLALVCETHLKPDKRLNITGYDIYRTDRVQQRGGGTAVFIKSYLPHYRNNVEDSENLEATSVTVNTKNGHINFVATYNPPTKMLLKTDLDIITADNNFLIGGDLNSKNTLWNSRLTNRNGRILEEHATEADYNIIAPESPTFYPANHLHRPDETEVGLVRRASSSSAVRYSMFPPVRFKSIGCLVACVIEFITWRGVGVGGWIKTWLALSPFPCGETPEIVSEFLYFLDKAISNVSMIRGYSTRSCRSVILRDAHVTTTIASRAQQRMRWTDSGVSVPTTDEAVTQAHTPLEGEEGDHRSLCNCNCVKDSIYKVKQEKTLDLRKTIQIKTSSSASLATWTKGKACPNKPYAKFALERVRVYDTEIYQQFAFTKPELAYEAERPTPPQ